MHNKVRSAGAGRLFRAVLLGAAIGAASPASSHQASTRESAAAATSRPSDVHDALDAARIGDLGPIDALLPRLDPASAEHALLEAQKAAALMREVEAAQALDLYFAAGDRDGERLSRAHGIAAETTFFAGAYGEAATHAARHLAVPAGRTADEIEGMKRLEQIARLLAEAPRQQLETAGTGHPVTMARDKVGLLRTKVRIGAASEDAVIDTGANLSVASAGAARRMGLRMIGGEASVGNSLGKGVGVRIGIADRVEIAGAVLRNLVFLVMEDEALTYPVPGGYRIDAIIGLPALRALGRLRFGPGDLLRVEPGRTEAAGPANLRLIGSDPYLLLSAAGKERPFFFDTGANRSSLSLRFTVEHPALVTADGGERLRGAAGGMEKRRKRTAERVALRLGEAEAVVPEMEVETETGEGGEQRYGVIGADLFRLFDKVVIDFAAMRVEAEPRR